MNQSNKDNLKALKTTCVSLFDLLVSISTTTITDGTAEERLAYLIFLDKLEHWIILHKKKLALLK